VTPAVRAAGLVEPGFEDVARAFEGVAGEGCAFAAVVGGRPVVEVCSPDWEPGAATVLYSGTKGVVATAVMVIADRGGLDLDAPVAGLWPQFGTAGKERVTVAGLLAHAAGLPGVEHPLDRADLADPRAVAARLAAQAPLVAPGVPCYHAVTWGWLAGEVCHRATRRGPAEVVDELLARPLGLALGIGRRRPTAGFVHPRPAPEYRLSAYAAPDPDPRLALVYANPAVRVDEWGTPELLDLEVAAVNGVASAPAMAAMYAAAVSGLVRPETLARVTRPSAEGRDPLTGRPLRFGATGHELAGTPSELGPPPDAFGHTGTGGGSHGAWPSLRTGFSFVTSDLRPEDGDGRAAAVLAALHRVVAAA
jgi:CubicO group peptidase (beta-lactamase class C family)